MRFLRLRQSLRQEELQIQFNLSRGAWSDYEKASSTPNLSGLLDIAAFFKISLDELILRDLEREARKKRHSPFQFDGTVEVDKWEFEYIRRELERLLVEIDTLKKKMA